MAGPPPDGAPDSGPDASTNAPDSGPTAWQQALHSRGLRLILLFLVAGGALVVWLDSIGGPELLRDRFGLWAAALIIPVQAVVSVSPFPSEVVAFGSTAVFGFWISFVMSWTAWMLAAFLQYFVARRTARDFDFEHARQYLPRWLDRFPVSHPAFLIVARWMPWGPHLVNSAAGVFGVSLVRHGWCAAISIVPHALVISALASGVLGGP